MSGPVSVLHSSDISVSYAAKDELTTSQENATVKRDISFAQAKLQSPDWEILIVPGARSTQFSHFCNPRIAINQRLLNSSPVSPQVSIMRACGNAPSCPSCKPFFRPSACIRSCRAYRALVERDIGAYFMIRGQEIHGLRITW